MILEEIRHRNKLTQEEFIKTIEVDSQSSYVKLVKDIKNGKKLPIKYAINLSNYFNISLDTIYSDGPQLRTLTQDVRAGDRRSGLTPSQRHSLCNSDKCFTAVFLPILAE